MKNAIANPSEPAGELSMGELLELFPQYLRPTTPRRGSIVEATVTSASRKGVFVNFGGKSDAFVPADQFGDLDLSIGKTGTFMVTGEADGDEMVELSAAMARPWIEISSAARSQSPLQVEVLRVARKGSSVSGVNVKLGPVTGFVPFKMLGVRPALVDNLVGKSLEVLVEEFSPESRKVIFNRKKISQAKQAELREKIMTEARPGDIFEGIVASIASKGPGSEPFGIFVDIGEGLTGLVHRSQIPGAGRKSCAEMFAVGDSVTVSLLPITGDNLAFSMKRVKSTKFIQGLEVGQVIPGTVVRKVAYGVFVSLSTDADVDGLLHKSQFPSGTTVEIGDNVQVKVVHIHRDTQVIGLSMRDSSQAS